MANRLIQSISMPIHRIINFNAGICRWIKPYTFFTNAPLSDAKQDLAASPNRYGVQTIRNYSSNTNEIVIPVVTYEQVKDIPNHPETTLIDVREPSELQETGSIPTSINIPCKIIHFLLKRMKINLFFFFL